MTSRLAVVGRMSVHGLKAHSHQARLRPSTSVDARLRPSTRVDGRRRPSTRVYADMEHMLKSVRVHTKRVYVRRRAQTRSKSKRARF